MTFKIFADRIIEMMSADLAFRNELISEGELSNGYNKEMERIHIDNSEKLNEIIDKIGFPTTEKVGKEANHAAWMIIQHSISSPVFMKKCADLLSVEVSLNKADPKLLATLTDRIVILEGNPQLYGTGFDWDENGVLNPNKYDDLDKVNERRKSIGLNTLEEQTKLIRQQALAENQGPPADCDLKKKQYEEWRKRVGWIN